MVEKGAFCLVLHSHVPYVLGHGRWPHGTDWLNEATCETYIPLLNTLNQLVEEGISPKLTIGLTPILCEQLKSPFFHEEFISYLENKIKASKQDLAEFTAWGEHEFANLAQNWIEFYEGRLEDFTKRYNRDLIGAFKKLQDEGHIEIITSAATHGYLPLLGEDTSVQAQIRLGVKNYERLFGREPAGIWLPECAYRPRYKWKNPIYPDAPEVLRKGIEEFLSEEGIEYFITDSHMLKGGRAIGVYLDRFRELRELWAQFEKHYTPAPEDIEKTPYEPYLVGSIEGKKPVAVFTRDPRTGLQVWSGEWGYPGDGWYLEFHKKRFPGGNRYWRVTSSKCDLGDKEIYKPEKVEGRLQENADHFVTLVHEILNQHWEEKKRKGVLCAPFDAELFGHWWFEGPRWIYKVYKAFSQSDQVRPMTLREYLAENPPSVVVDLPEGSWGEGGFHWIWLNDWTKWTWKYIYEAEEKIKELASKFVYNNDSRGEALLKQLARELLLLESSDWQFLISTWSARDYAEMRVVRHYENFMRLARILQDYMESGSLTEGQQRYIEGALSQNAPFPELDISWWARVGYPPE